jgi:hypothetical protein
MSELAGSLPRPSTAGSEPTSSPALVADWVAALSLLESQVSGALSDGPSVGSGEVKGGCVGGGRSSTTETGSSCCGRWRS